jgi:AcrR family transcriptional regulator
MWTLSSIVPRMRTVYASLRRRYAYDVRMSTAKTQPLTRRRIVDAAMDVVEHDGLDGLSMRRVAAAAGCKVMSLYRHIENKDDLLDALIDEIYVGIAAPPADAPWRSALRSMAIAEREALVRHPWACALLAARFPGPARRRHMDALLRVLASASLPEPLADLGYHALVVHVHGFALLQVGFEGAAEKMSQDVRSYLLSTPEGETPNLVAHYRYHVAHGHETDDFTAVLDLILDGLERAAVSYRPPVTPRRGSAVRPP